MFRFKASRRFSRQQHRFGGGRSAACAQQAGFTLIEIMIVVVILATLGALVVPNLIGQDDRARVVAAQSDLNAVANALELYRLDLGRYPSAGQGLRALVERPSGSKAKRWQEGGYLKKKRIPEDPWGTPYQYNGRGHQFTLFSFGRDGSAGGEGYDSDLYYKDL